MSRRPLQAAGIQGLRASAGSSRDRAAKGSSLGLLEEHLFELPGLSKGNNASWFWGLEHLRRHGLGRHVETLIPGRCHIKGDLQSPLGKRALLVLV